MVGLSWKSVPSPAGHQPFWLTPLGIVTKAMRRGATNSLASTRDRISDSNAGSARHVPKPCRKPRRVTDDAIANRVPASGSLFIANLPVKTDPFREAPEKRQFQWPWGVAAETPTTR